MQGKDDIEAGDSQVTAAVKDLSGRFDRIDGVTHRKPARSDVWREPGLE